MDLNIINNLLENLPQKDITLSKKFIENREWVKLKELVDSALYKVSKSQHSAKPKPEYADIDINKLNELQIEVTLLVSEVCPEEFEDGYLDEITRMELINSGCILRNEDDDEY